MRARALAAQRSGSFVPAVMSVLICLVGIAEASQDDLLGSLIEKNEAAWQKIQSLQSIQYTLEREWLDRRSQKPLQGTAQIKKKGDSLWCVNRSTIRTGPLQVVAQRDIRLGNTTRPMRVYEPNTVGGQTRQSEQRVVVNDGYVAFWPEVGNPLAYRWDHNSVDTMDSQPRNMVRTAVGRDFLSACFGTEGARFREATRMNVDRVRYEAVRVKAADGRDIYQIRRHYPKDSPTADLIWVIDPDKGYLAVESTFYASGETPRRCQTMRVEEVAPGLWYPVACEEVRYAAPGETAEAPAVTGWTKITVKDLKLNEPIPDEQFEIDALRLKEDKPDIIVGWRTLDGVTTSYVYRDGKLVPQHEPKR